MIVNTKTWLTFHQACPTGNLADHRHRTATKRLGHNILHNYENNNIEFKTTYNRIYHDAPAVKPITEMTMRPPRLSHAASKDETKALDYAILSLSKVVNGMRCMSIANIKQALQTLKSEGIKLGPAWDRAHELAQAHEGEPAYDRLHAFLHRAEGDTSNAAYWYRRAGEPAYEDDLKSECDLLIERFTDQSSAHDSAKPS